MKIAIRSARPEDYPAAEAIMEQVQRLHVGWRPDIYRLSEKTLPQELYRQAADEGRLFVAEYQGGVAGVLLLQFRHIENCNQVTRDVLLVDAMAVEEACRGKGVGHAFFDFLKRLKIEKGFDGIELQVNAKNQAAYQMYRKYGFTEKSICMELLDRPTGGEEKGGTSMTNRELILEAIAARTQSYSPYSHFQVGAALLGESGRVYRGCNIENAAYTPTNCAERTAFFSAVSQGERRFVKIAIAAGPEGGALTGASPCGVCRQVMMEFCSPETFQILMAHSPEEYRTATLKELLPEGFGPDNL